MSRAARVLWVCAVTATLCFVALVVLSKGGLEPDGLTIFDSRLFGYSPQEARTYLAALEQVPQARDTYLGTFRWLDTAFPVLLAISLAGAVWLNTSQMPALRRVLILCAPVGYLLMDLLENADVARMVQAGSTVADDVVMRASGFTTAKWQLLAVSLVLMIGLVLRARKRGRI